MKSTGFGISSMPAPPAPPPPGPPAEALGNFHVSNAAAAPPRVPGTAPGNPYRGRGVETPHGGLVPGHMPLRESRDRGVLKSVPFPASDRMEKQPFVRNERGQRQDWRAVGVANETSRRTPGRVARSGANQGRYQKIVAEKLSGMSTKTKSNMSTGLGAVGMLMAMVSFQFKYHKTLGVGLLMVAVAAVLYMYKDTNSATEYATGNALGDTRHDQIRDTSRKQRYQPLHGSDPDHNPYPKHLDQAANMQQQLAKQGTDMNNMEGPRDRYKYKRGPTPANQPRLRNDKLMRDASMSNMDEQELAEYMARLEGEAPDRFYQAHAYHPLAPHQDHQNKIDDMNTIHGVSTQPGQMLRKSKYIDPRIQQAGAKTSHLKNPPPGAIEPLDKTHPWLEKQAGTPIGQAFDMDNYQENMHGGGGAPPISQHALNTGVSSYDEKISNQDGGRLMMERQAEDRMLQGPIRDRNPDDVPPELEPIPTSRAGMMELRQKKEQQARLKMAKNRSQQQQMSQSYQQQQQTDLPFPQQGSIVQPQMYAGMKGPAMSPEDQASSDFESVFNTKSSHPTQW